MDTKGSKPVSSPQLPSSHGNKTEPPKGKGISPTSSDPSGSKTGHGDASAVMLTVGSSQKTGSLEHVAQVHKPGAGPGQNQGQAKSHLTTHSSEPRLHKSPNSARAQTSSVDSPRTSNPRHNLVVTTFRVPAKESPKTQHSKAVKDSPKTNSSASTSQTAAKDSKNHNKLAASHIPVKVSPKMTKASSKTSMKESPNNTSSTALSLSDDLSPVSDDGNLVHALRVDVSPVPTAPPVAHQEVKQETKPISPTKQDAQKPSKEDNKPLSSPRAQPKEPVTQAHSPQPQSKDKPHNHKVTTPSATTQHKPLHASTKTQHDNTSSSTAHAAQHTSAPGSQHSASPNTKHQTPPAQVASRQTATQREKSVEKKGKESEGKGGVRGKDAGKSEATMTGAEARRKDVGVQVSDDLCNGGVVTSQLSNHLTQDNTVVMRSNKPTAGKRPSSQYVCQIDIELCSQLQPGSTSMKPTGDTDIPSDQSEAKGKAGEGLRQEKAGPVQEVTWDAQGLTWEVYGATLDWQALGSAVQRHLRTQIEQLEHRLRTLQNCVSEKEKEKEEEEGKKKRKEKGKKKGKEKEEKDKESLPAAAHRPRRKCRCWFHCSSCCCRRKQRNA